MAHTSKPSDSVASQTAASRPHEQTDRSGRPDGSVERMARNREFLLKFKSDIERKDLKEFVSGWSAAFVNILITFPINKVMFRQMAYGVKAKSAVSQFKGENLLYIYRGMVPPLISKTISGTLRPSPRPRPSSRPLTRNLFLAKQSRSCSAPTTSTRNCSRKAKR